MQPLPTASDPLIGTRIDARYTVRGLLGRGAQAVVYEAMHDELARPVAIKVLDATWACEATAISRFLREARTASALSHSHIVDVSDLGRLSDGRPYLVMPKISGVPLTQLLEREGPQVPARVARLLAGVASALDLTHARGIVHRDIKPENLMFVQQDGAETVLLLDFGIAVLSDCNAPRLTQRNAFFGTPEYMPPEVWAGELPDGRGDVYALATVAFELITGRLPFQGDNALQLLAQKYRTHAPALSEVGGGSFSPALEAVFRRALARDPRSRTPSASGFVAALQVAADSGEEDEHERARPQTPLGVAQRRGESARTGQHAHYALMLRPGRRLQLRAAFGRARARLATQLQQRKLWRKAQDRTVTARTLLLQKRRRSVIPLLAAAFILFAPNRIDTRSSPTPEPSGALAKTSQRQHRPGGEATQLAAASVAQHGPELAHAGLTAAAHDPPQPSAAGSPSSAPAAQQATTPQPSAATSPTRSAKAVARAAQYASAGTAALLQGQLERARGHFRAALASDPDNAHAWRGLGIVLERNHETQQALAAYRRYLSLAPSGPQPDAVRKRMRALAH